MNAAHAHDVVIVDAVRTPFGRFGGVLREVSSIDLGTHVVRELLHRTGVSAEAIGELYHGTAMAGEVALSTNIPARQIALKAGLPSSVHSLTIDRACCSSMTAIHLAYRSIRSGEAEAVIVTGADNMSRVPHMLSGMRWGKKIGHAEIVDGLFELGYKGWAPVACDAGQSAADHQITREEQDEWAYRSQLRYQQAKADGFFSNHVVPVTDPGKTTSDGDLTVLREDEFPKPHTTLEALAKLPDVYGSGTVTAGNSPGLDAGAAGLMLMSRQKAEQLSLRPLAVISAIASVADSPELMATVPGLAMQKLLQKLQRRVQDIHLFEINEAFAAVPLVSSLVLSQGNQEDLHYIRERLNVNGGAIAVGHPVGASGARIAMTLMYELLRRGGGTGLAAICGGLAQGDGLALTVDER